MGCRQPGNANFGWLQHFIYHLAPADKQVLCLQKAHSLPKQRRRRNKKSAGRRRLDRLYCKPAGKVVLNTQIPAALWFMSRNRKNGKFRDRSKEILFIDARNLGHLINRRTKELTHEDIMQIANTYHSWRNKDGKYEDVPGFCMAAPITKVKELDYVLTPGRYVGLPDDEDDFDFAERFASLKKELELQIAEEAKLNEIIAANLKKIKINE